jgi:lycopene beta-cyclase
LKPEPNINTHYDFIIAGGGMAGLSLAYYFNQSQLKDKKILIIDKEPKTHNDRTWCFWEVGESAFEHILYKKWDSVLFGGVNGNLRRLDIGNYHYKMLRGIDFYQYVYKSLSKNPNIQFYYSSIKSIEDKSELVEVITDNQTFTANYVFDSVYKLNLMENVASLLLVGEGSGMRSVTGRHNLLQHFKGLVIETPKATFDPSIPVMMNFGIEQHDECRFIYVLPITETKALIEFTLFTENLLTQEEYDAELQTYIKNQLKIENYTVCEDEFGVIPMTDEPTDEFPSERVVRIGTAGGYTNPSTGYTFSNTQRRLQQIVTQLEKTGNPQIKTSWFQKRHLLYAAILLNVLKNKRHSAADVFDKLYLRNPPKRIFKFLDGDTNFFEELLVMNSTPVSKFAAAAIDVIFNSKK